MSNPTDLDSEIIAMQTIFDTLKGLSGDEQHRVLTYIASRLELDITSSIKTSSMSLDKSLEEDTVVDNQETEEFLQCAELFDKTKPGSNSEKALVVAYWLMISKGQESFVAHSINKELKHLGVGVPNITGALDRLMSSDPALILQIRKDGKSRQARKVYKLTHAGTKKVKDMIRE